jgi:hypothetical protein
MMETFNKEQRAEVEKVLEKIGQEEKVNMKARLRRIGTSKYAGIGSKVSDTVGARLVRSREGDYKTLEIGSIHGRAIGGRGMNLAILLAEGKPEGEPVRDPPEKIVDGIVAGWDKTASIVNKRKGRQDRKKFGAYIKTISRR